MLKAYNNLETELAEKLDDIQSTGAETTVKVKDDLSKYETPFRMTVGEPNKGEIIEVADITLSNGNSILTIIREKEGTTGQEEGFAEGTPIKHLGTAGMHTELSDEIQDNSQELEKKIDETDFLNHSTRHEEDGDDRINVSGLSGELEDEQKPKNHDLGGTTHNSSSLENLNAKINDATLDDESEKRPPDSHDNEAHSVNFSSKHLSINEQTETSYTLQLSDDGNLIDCNNSDSFTLNIPENDSVNFQIGTQVLVRQKGSGSVAAEGVGEVELDLVTGENTTRAENSLMGLIKVATDTWTVFGDLE